MSEAHIVFFSCDQMILRDIIYLDKIEVVQATQYEDWRVKDSRKKEG